MHRDEAFFLCPALLFHLLVKSGSKQVWALTHILMSAKQLFCLLMVGCEGGRHFNSSPVSRVHDRLASQQDGHLNQSLAFINVQHLTFVFSPCRVYLLPQNS